MKTRNHSLTMILVVLLIAGCHPALPGQAQSDLPADWSIPQRYERKMVAKRVRFFPEKLLALTFDDGPSKDFTPRILDILATYKAHATFFVRGDQAELYPDLLKRIVAEGNVIGNHSFSHPKKITSADAIKELFRTEKVIQTTGQTPRLFRPPYGIIKNDLTQLALKKGYTVVTWTISSADSRPIGADVIANNVIHTPNPGDIVIMHDGEEHHEATVEALPTILKQLGDSGYKFVTIPELLRAWDKYLQEQKAISK